MMVAQVADGTTVTVSGECIRAHLERLSGVRHPNTGPRGLSAAADYIGEQLREVGAVVSEHFFTVDGFRGKFRNVEGVINAGSTTNECVICAHYDTVCNSPGADDNASGVGVMLEAARVLAECGVERRIRCIGFTLEEGSPVEGDTSRLLGSRAWVACMRDRCINVGAVINLESVGYVGDFQRYPCHLDPTHFLNHKLDAKRGGFIAILSYEKSTDLGQVCFNQCRSPVDVPTVLVQVSLKQVKERFRDILRSDHTSFWKKCLPAITLTDTAELRTPHYHTERDTLDKVDIEFAGKVCLATVLTALKAELGKTHESPNRTNHATSDCRSAAEKSSVVGCR